MFFSQFIEKFQEVKEGARKSSSNGTAFPTTPVTSANASPITGRLSLRGENAGGAPLNDSASEQPDANIIAAPPALKDEPDKNAHIRTTSLSGLQVQYTGVNQKF